MCVLMTIFCGRITTANNVPKHNGKPLYATVLNTGDVSRKQQQAKYNIHIKFVCVVKNVKWPKILNGTGSTCKIILLERGDWILYEDGYGPFPEARPIQLSDVHRSTRTEIHRIQELKRQTFEIFFHKYIYICYSFTNIFMRRTSWWEWVSEKFSIESFYLSGRCRPMKRKNVFYSYEYGVCVWEFFDRTFSLLS